MRQRLSFWLKKVSILLFLSSCATGSSLVERNIIKPGMTKGDLDFVLAYRSFLDQVNIPTGYREYFSNERKEILAPDKADKDIYYVFRNVYQPVKCGWLMCNSGDGILDKTFSNYSDAVNYVTGVKKEPKQTITIEENGQVAEIPVNSKKGTVVSDLSGLIESFKSGKISREDFEERKKQILDE